MALWQGTSRRKPTGGRLIRAQKKRRSEIAREHIDAHVGEHKQKLVRTKGANQKIKVLATDKINVTDPKSGKTAAATLTNVTENAANIHYVRRNIITKGAIVETSAGKARVTSRPGQDGALSGVLVE
ncbi:MAG: 30S ribosomal protein S8e [Thermoplasmatota archaeon]